MWLPPRPFNPATAIRTRSFAPIIFARPFVPLMTAAVPAAKEAFKKLRRVVIGFFIIILLLVGLLKVFGLEEIFAD